jgi:hypothetical protein
MPSFGAKNKSVTMAMAMSDSDRMLLQRIMVNALLI